MDRSTEMKIIHDIQTGQTDQFSVLYEQHFQSLYNHIYYKTMNQELTEDIVSDAFFKAFDSIGSFQAREGSTFRSRLYTIANNLLLDDYKKKKADWLDDDIDLEDPDQNVTKTEHNRYISEQIMKHLDALGEKKKELVIMRVREWLSYEEIAEITWRNQTALRKELSYTIAQLREACWDLIQ